MTGPAGLFADLGRRDRPVIGRELAAEPAADVVALHLHVGRRDVQRRGEARRGLRHVLRRKIGRQLAVFPFHGRAVRLQAAMRDGVDAILAFDHMGRFLEQPLDLLVGKSSRFRLGVGLFFELDLAAAGAVRPAAFAAAKSESLHEDRLIARIRS